MWKHMDLADIANKIGKMGKMGKMRAIWVKSRKCKDFYFNRFVVVDNHKTINLKR